MRLAALAFLAAAAAAPAAAQDVVATDPSSILSVLSANGLQGTITVDSHGFPEIETRASRSDWSVYFYDCNAKNRECQSVQFSTAWELQPGQVPSLREINDFNEERRFVTAWLDDEGYPVLEMDVLMRGGLNRELFEEALDSWIFALGEFEALIGW